MNMNTKKVLLMLGGFFILLLACGPVKPLPARFWPLEEENQWTTAENYTWKVTNYGSDSSSSTTTNSVEPFEERDDGKLVWPVATTTQGDSTVYSRNYYYMTEDSVYIYSMDKNLEDPSAVEPQNLAVGVEWNGNLAIPITIPSFSTNFPAHFKVIGIQDVTVPAGTFNCYVVVLDLDNNGTSIDSAAMQWRAEGVGIVKFTTDFQTKYSIGPVSFDVEVHGKSEMQSKQGF